MRINISCLDTCSYCQRYISIWWTYRLVDGDDNAKQRDDNLKALSPSIHWQFQRKNQFSFISVIGSKPIVLWDCICIFKAEEKEVRQWLPLCWYSFLWFGSINQAEQVCIEERYESTKNRINSISDRCNFILKWYINEFKWENADCDNLFGNVYGYKLFLKGENDFLIKNDHV